MYKIETFVWKKEPVVPSASFVHPFYKTMFRKLYGLDEAQAEVYTGDTGAVTYNCDFVAPLVRKVWDGHKNDITRFYDIRINEEMGQTAPEYAILKMAGIRNISPVNIRGMGSMAWLMGLQLMGLDTIEENCAIILLAELEHDLDMGEYNTACAFALYPYEKINDSKGIWITDYRLYLTVDEVGEAINNFKGRIILPKEGVRDIPVNSDSVICKGHGLTEPLLYLFKIIENAESGNVIAIHRSGDRYGLVYYRALGKEGGRDKDTGRNEV